MSELPFVGRQYELQRLDSLLEQALAGQGCVGFVTGEPGIGKSALVLEFTRRAQDQHKDLVVAVGECNAQTGVGEPYLPWREILGQLTGDLEAKLEEGAITVENAERLKKLLARSGLLLLEVAPDLLGLLPAVGIFAKLLSPVGKAVVKQTGLQAQLQAVVERKPELLELSRTAVEQEHVFEQFTNFLRKLSADSPLLIVLDDLQWADSSSLDLLFHLGRRLASNPLLILGTFRPEEIAFGRAGERHPLEKVLAELKRLYGDTMLDLGKVDTSRNQQLVHELLDSEANDFDAGFRQALCHHTACNPLFVLELVRTMRERGDIRQDHQGRWIASATLDWNELPGRVEGVIQERVDRLEKELQETLTVGSVEGEDFTAEIVAQVRQVDERSTVRELSGELGKRHDLVEATGIRRLESTRLSLYRFKHQLIQKYLYERLDEVELAWMHEDVGNILERLYQGQLDDVALQLARHFSVAGLNEKAAHYLRRAGEQAARRFAHEEAIQHLTRALELTPARDAHARLELLLEREAVYGWRGQRESQAADLAEMARLTQMLHEPGLEAEVRLRQADYARTTGAYESALAHAQGAVTLAERAGDGSREARAYGLWGRILLNKGDYAEAPEWLSLALELAQAAGDEAEVAETYYLLGLAHFYLHDYAQARDFMTQAQAAYRDMVSGKGEVNSLLFLGTLEIRFGNYGAAIDLLRRGLDVCRSIGWRKREAMILSSLGSTYVELGDYAAALHHHHQALLIAAEVGDRAGEAISLDTIGMVHQRRQESRQGLDFLQRALAIQREVGDRSGESYTLSHLGFALADLGDAKGAGQAFQEAIAIRQRLGTDQSAVVDDLAGLAHAALIDGQAEQAQAYVDDVLAWIEANGTQQVEYPVQVAWICYQVLRERANRDPSAAPRAQAVLQQGYQLLQTQASAIVEGGLRRQFLEAVPFNRDLMAAWEAAS